MGSEPGERPVYRLVYEAISGDPAAGEAAMVPWDTAIFGFPVASIRAGFDDKPSKTFPEAFSAWMGERRVAVCLTCLAPERRCWRRLLPRVGFEFVDLTLQLSLALASAKLPPVRFPLRRAVPGDHSAIEAIAAGSFSHGRYHADPRFPRELANRRYTQWVKNALTAPGDVDRVYVMEEGGRVAGFYHVTIEEDVSDLRLAAVAAGAKTTMLGVELYAAMLHELRRLQVRRVVTSISAMNTNIVNLYSMLGFRFSGPEIVYHWHAVKEGCE